MVSFDVNWLAVLASAVLSMVVGFVWYAEPVFGKMWSKLVDSKKKDLNPNPMTYLLTFIGTLVGSFVVANMVTAFGAVEFVDGVVVGVMAGLVALIALNANYMFEQRPFRLLLLDGLYHAVWMGLAGGLLAVWV
ncbi:MAG: DUF1761 domain-containing protein [Candidatus Dojkabacteria bacterium]